METPFSCKRFVTALNFSKWATVSANILFCTRVGKNSSRRGTDSKESLICAWQQSIANDEFQWVLVFQTGSEFVNTLRAEAFAFVIKVFTWFEASSSPSCSPIHFLTARLNSWLPHPIRGALLNSVPSDWLVEQLSPASAIESFSSMSHCFRTVETQVLCPSAVKLSTPSSSIMGCTESSAFLCSDGVELVKCKVQPLLSGGHFPLSNHQKSRVFFAFEWALCVLVRPFTMMQNPLPQGLPWGGNQIADFSGKRIICHLEWEVIHDHPLNPFEHRCLLLIDHIVKVWCDHFTWGLWSSHFFQQSHQVWSNAGAKMTFKIALACSRTLLSLGFALLFALLANPMDRFPFHRLKKEPFELTHIPPPSRDGWDHCRDGWSQL